MPNAFTDGSVTHPKMPSAALATCSCWIPGRTDIHIPESLTMFADFRFDADGLVGYTKLGGCRPSSTRAELLGLIIASLIPIAIHIAIDNHAV
eukprot:1737100-Karenia_brevis.AAC.1